MSLKTALFSTANTLFPDTTRVVLRIRDEINFLTRLCNLFEYFAVAFCALFQIYAMIIGSSIWYAHLVLLILSLDYFIYKLIIKTKLENIDESDIEKAKKHRLKNELKRNLNKINKLYAIVSITLRCFVIITSIHSLIIAPNALKIIFTTLVTAELIVEIPLRIFINLIKKRYDELISTFESESEILKNKIYAPVNKAKEVYNNVVNKFSGEHNPIFDVADKLGGLFRKKIIGKKGTYIERSEFSYEENQDEETV